MATFYFSYNEIEFIMRREISIDESSLFKTFIKRDVFLCVFPKYCLLPYSALHTDYKWKSFPRNDAELGKKKDRT